MTDVFDNWTGDITIDGRKVRKCRNSRGLSVEALAEKACVGKTTIERWEAKGVGNADIEKVRSVMAVLEYDLRRVLTPECQQEMEQMSQDSGNETLASERQRTGEPAALVSSPRFQLLPELRDFVGREEELAEILDLFQGNGRCAAISSLCGMGGVGKTTIAMKIAHRIKGQFPDAQLYIDLQGVSERPVATADAMKRFIRAFDPTTPHLEDANVDLAAIYRSMLAGKRALIILDNAGSEDQVKHLIAGDTTAFIITSRNALALDGVRPLRIDVFSDKKALELLRAIVGAKGSNAELHKVAALCGHLPLALRVAGDFLRLKEGWTVRDYIAALEKETLRWLNVGNDPQKNVEAVLKLSAAQLVRDNVELATRWHYLADWQADFARDAAAAAWNVEDEFAVLDDLANLVNRSLVEFNAETGRYRLHDLMKPIAEGLFA
jgi:transcriptional regulator with XRE-family HTH domain